MKKTILKLRKFFSSFVPYKRCHLHLPISSDNFQQILLNLANTGIVDSSPGLFGSIEKRYFVKLRNNGCFDIDGPHAYKRLCLKTQGQIDSISNNNDEVILDLKMRPSNREILILLLMWLFLLFIVIVVSVVSLTPSSTGSQLSILPIVMLIWFTFVSILWYGGTTINFQDEARRIINILKYQFSS
ncbi:hypothetical protein [Calothrix sp. NIES-2098]|uniref:hypothetical protein n=1 Tax=Calothrix sp. NIES-2098 TaxID=1954171 RepID=UPI000B5E6E9A|nr:hypothetical protein NIES2098_22980 [Calothrix sp. NIES-2098]